MFEKITDSGINESYLYLKHPSGLKIYLMKKSGYSSCHAIFGTAYGSVDTKFSLNGGESVTVPEGIAHFLEHKLFESEELDAFEQFAKTGAYANAYTSFDRTCYLFGCSANLKENLKILLGFVQSPYFTAETVKKEQGIIGQEIQMYEDDPDWRVLFNCFRGMYLNNPVKIEIAGTRDSIAKIDDKLLYKCYNTFYNLSNMFLCVVGDFDENEIAKLIDENLKPGDPVQISRDNHNEPKTIVTPYCEQTLAVAKPMFMLGFKDEVTESGGYVSLKKQLATELLLEVIASKASPLYKRLVEKQLLSDEISYEYFCTRNVAAVLFGGESDDCRKAAEEILLEAENIRKQGINAELFEAAKKCRYGKEILRFDNVQSIASMLVESAVQNTGLFDSINILREIKIDDLEQCLNILTKENSVLSVIKNS